MVDKVMLFKVNSWNEFNNPSKGHGTKRLQSHAVECLVGNTYNVLENKTHGPQSGALRDSSFCVYVHN